jgi:hypothetical protein
MGYTGERENLEISMRLDYIGLYRIQLRENIDENLNF